MKRTIAIRLLPTSVQAESLRALQSTFSAACSTLAGIAFDQRCTNRVRLHHLAYYTVRAAYPALGAQLACNAIAAVTQSLKAHRANGRDWQIVRFRSDGSVHLDARTYRLLDREAVSVFTMGARERIAMRTGAFQRRYLDAGTIREAQLCRRRGRWYLHVVLDLPGAAAIGGNVLGVDLGENVAAAPSTGALYGGGALRDTRDRFLAFRKRLQRDGSQSAKQLLARVSGRESRHVRHVNHEISACIVREAVQRDDGTIVLENLTNIRERIAMGKRMRTRLHRWAWRQLQAFIEYKAQAAGIRVLYVNPAYTSQPCSVCGTIGTRRKHRLSCKECGIFAHSDRNAARNLAKIGMSALVPTGDVVRPHVAA